ncbi:TIM barrel protein [Verrucomicrobiota bacterium sgz303538]
MSSFSRRHFLQLTGAGLAFAASRPLRAIEPFARKGAPILRPSLAAYSFRDFFKPGIQPAEQQMDYYKFIDYCAEHGCEGAELTSYYFPKDVSDEELLKVRRYAFLRGIAVSGTSVGNDFTRPLGPDRDKEIADVKRWIDRAAVLGAPHIRVFAGYGKGIAAAEAQKLCISALEECCDYAGKHGIFLGLENHGGIVAEPEGLLEIVRMVKSPWLGINLDSGNFHTADPYASFAMCAPYAVNVQIKADIRARDQKTNQPADIPRLIGILREANYQGWVALEYEAKPSPWEGVPPLLAQLNQLMKQADAQSTWTPLFDGKTLKGWKVTEFGGRGEVTVQDGAIVLDAGNDLTGINLAGEPQRMNYEVELEAKRVEGSDFFCGLTFPVEKNNVTLVVGGWGGTMVGISSIDGMDASENETSFARKFDNNRWYRIRVRVTPGKIQAWIDDEQVANVSTEGRKLSMRAGEIESSEPFGIASFRTRAALRDIKIRKAS